MFLKTKKEIENWLNQYKVKNFIINDDLTVNVNDEVLLNKKGLIEIPIKFNIVKGFFSCRNNQLTSLKFAPEKVDGSFFVIITKLSKLIMKFG